MKITLFIAALFLLSAIAVTQIDDSLNDDAIKLIDKLDLSHDSKAYLYFSGIFASENDDPAQVGHNQLSEYQRHELDKSYVIVDYMESKKIPLPSGDLFCGFWEAGCLEPLFLSEVDISALLEQHEILINRAKKFYQFDEYKTLTKPFVDERYPSYGYLSAVERIAILHAISKHKEGDTSDAIDMLLDQLKNARRMIELQDNLIGKLVFLMKLSEIIDVASIILSQSEEKIEIGFIHGLTNTEKSFDLAATREFGLMYYTFKDLDKNPEFFRSEGNFPGWLSRIAYKPNMTINAITPIYSRLKNISNMTPNEFSHEIENISEDIASTSKIRNYVGNVLITLSPNFDQYVARFMDLDAKLVIFNQLYHFRRDAKSAENPYYKGNYPSVRDGEICFSGPLEDNRQLRCLQTKI